jgi:hypothetical protein
MSVVDGIVEETVMLPSSVKPARATPAKAEAKSVS